MFEVALKEIEDSTKFELVNKETGEVLTPYETYMALHGNCKVFTHEKETAQIWICNGYSVIVDTDPNSKLNEEYLKQREIKV